MKFSTKVEVTRIVSLENLLGLMYYRSLHGWEAIDLQLPLNNDPKGLFTFSFSMPHIDFYDIPVWEYDLKYPFDGFDFSNVEDENGSNLITSVLRHFLLEELEAGWQVLTSAKFPDIGKDTEDVRPNKIGFLMKKASKRPGYSRAMSDFQSLRRNFF